ncbi:MAG: anthranilate synthase component I family protein [Polyangiaceae bacterium]
MVVRAVPLPADAIAIARALSSRPGLAVLASRPVGAPRPADARFSFVACDPDSVSEDLLPPTESEGPARGWDGAPPAPRWMGVVPYDALRGIERPRWTRHPETRPEPLHARPRWQRYPAVVRIDHATGAVCVEAVDDAAADRLLARAGSVGQAPSPFHLRVEPPDEPDEAHLERVRRALQLIAEGDLYQVNLARRIRLSIRGDLLSLFASLLDAAPAPWGFFQDLGSSVVCASSPELALSVEGRTLRSCPIKGTRPRGHDAAEDFHNSRELDADPKERAELVMSVDVHRNDLGAVAVPGSVHVTGEPRVTAGRTVWSRVAEVVALRAPGIDTRAVLRACLPAGSVTGAPKVRAMEVIASLEPWRRGAYTGVFGHAGRGGSATLAMAIRTIEMEKGPAEHRGVYFTGGGIVADSVPGRELEETRWKAMQLEALGGAGGGGAHELEPGRSTD